MDWSFESDKNDLLRSALPSGEYNILVYAQEMKQTKAGNEALKLTFKVTEGEFKGKVIFQQYNLSGNEEAVKISRGQLKSLLVSANHNVNISGPHEFVGLEVTAMVKIEKSDMYGEQNRISYFKPLKKSAPKDNGVPF